MNRNRTGTAQLASCTCFRYTTTAPKGSVRGVKGAEIKNLPGKKIIFTNGSRKHAKNVVSNLQLDENLFSIFDIVDCEFIPKPERFPYERLIKKYEIIPEQSIFFEDIARNLKPAHDLGMKTGWVINEDNWAKEGHDEDHVHFKIKQLDHFLEQCNLLIK